MHHAAKQPVALREKSLNGAKTLGLTPRKDVEKQQPGDSPCGGEDCFLRGIKISPGEEAGMQNTSTIKI